MKIPLVCYLGETVMANKYKISVNFIRDIESGYDFVQAEEGKKFIEIGITIENISEDVLSVFSLLDFKSSLDGVEIDEELTTQCH